MKVFKENFKIWLDYIIGKDIKQQYQLRFWSALNLNGKLFDF